jgi:hypothetical protein
LFLARVFLARVTRVFRQFPERTTKSGQHFPSVIQVKEIDRRRVLAFKKSNLQLPQEAGCRHPEIIPYHDDTLHPTAIALPQGLKLRFDTNLTTTRTTLRPTRDGRATS